MGKTKLDLRERVFARGMNYPSDAELLMLVLGSGTKDKPVEEIAYRMLDAIDVNNGQSLVDAFLKIPGVGMGKAMAVAAAIDSMKFRQIVGSIAGDDTIMMALKTNEDAVKVYKEIKSVIED